MRNLKLAIMLLALTGLDRLAAMTYEIGPGLAYTRLSAIDWSTLQPGDVVNIHGQAAHYKEMIVIGSSGTASAPITVNGVAGAGGEPVVIDGNGATTDAQFAGISTTYIQGLGTVITYHASYVTITGISFTGADSTNTFTNSAGTTAAFGPGAAGLYILGPSDHITVNQCSIFDNGNGFFVNSNNNISSNVLVQYCRLWENGVVGSYLEHNWYSETLGITVQYCYFGPTRLDSAGSQFKSRDVGLVFRYNYLDAGEGVVPDFSGGSAAYAGNGARKMDMVDIEASALMGHISDADYQNTDVYGNIFINDENQSSDCIHYGGDSGVNANYRQGTLYFYNNTFEFVADQADIYKAGIFDVVSPATVLADNNIFHQDTATAGGVLTALGFMCSGGNLTLGANYASPGISDWMITDTPASTITTGYGDANCHLINAPGDNPGFIDRAANNLGLAAGSVCIAAGGALPGAVATSNPVTSGYLVPLQSQSRSSATDLGAFASGASSGTTTSTGATTATTGTTTSATTGTTGTTSTTGTGSGTASTTAAGSASAGASGSSGSGPGGGGACGLGGGLGVLLALALAGRRLRQHPPGGR